MKRLMLGGVLILVGLLIVVLATEAVAESKHAVRDSSITAPFQTLHVPGPVPTTPASFTPTPSPTNTPLGPPVRCPPEYQDLAQGDPGFVDVHYLDCLGAIENYPCGQPGEPCVPPNTYPYFRPAHPYAGARGEICKLIVLGEGWPLLVPPTPTFSDVPTTSPYYPYVETAYAHAMITGYSDGTFRPLAQATRGELCKMIVLAAGWTIVVIGGPHYTDVPTSHPFYVYIETVYYRGVMNGYCDGTFLPDGVLGDMARVQIAIIIYDTLMQPPHRPNIEDPPPLATCEPVGSATATLSPVPSPTNPITQTPTIIPTSTSTGTPCPSCPTVTTTATPTETATATPSIVATATATSAPCTISFTDVHSSDYFYQAVEYLACHGVVSGYSDGTFRPYNNTTRGQMTKIVVLGFGIPIWTPSGTPTFSDVPTNNAFYQYVETAAHNNIVSGYADGTFRPGNNVTRGQLSKIIVLGAVFANGWTLVNPPTPTFTDVPIDSPFYTYVETAYCHQIISGYSDGTFRPGNNATRGQISKIQYLAIINQVTCGATPTAVVPRR